MKQMLYKKGLDHRNPKDIFRAAAQNNLIEDPGDLVSFYRLEK